MYCPLSGASYGMGARGPLNGNSGVQGQSPWRGSRGQLPRKPWGFMHFQMPRILHTILCWNREYTSCKQLLLGQYQAQTNQLTKNHCFDKEKNSYFKGGTFMLNDKTQNHKMIFQPTFTFFPFPLSFSFFFSSFFSRILGRPWPTQTPRL